MKMSKLIPMAVVALLAPAAAQSQSTVNASATVANYSALSGTGALSFGTLSRTVDNSISAVGGATTRGLDYNYNLTVSFANVPANLTATVNSQSVNLPVALKCAYKIGTGSWSSAAACGSAGFNLDVGAALTSATLGFGGDISAANTATAPAATYTGSFDIVLTAR
jgi:hypothetical protein